MRRNGISILLIGMIVALAPPAGAATISLDAVDSGWYNQFGLHNPTNENYIVGWTSVEHHNFLVFDLSSISETIISATLRLENFQSLSPDPTETLEFYSVETDIPTLRAGGTDLAIYNDLAGGDLYAQAVLPGGIIQGNIVEIGLNGTGLGALNAAVGLFAFGGQITTLAKGFDEEYYFGFTSENSLRQLVVETSDEPQPVPEPSDLMTLLVALVAAACWAGRTRL